MRKALIHQATRRIPGLRRLPVGQLLIGAELMLLAHDHIARLEPHERRRVLALLRTGRGRTRNLSPTERDELRELLAKAEPRLFAGLVAEKFSPVRLPRRMTRGKSRN